MHVPLGKTLTIQAGTVVQFNGGTNLTIDGTLIAQGTSGQIIYFTSSRDNSPLGGANNAGNGDWGAITFGIHSAANSLSYVQVRYAGGGGSAILDQTSALSFTSSTIANSGQVGLRIE